MGINIKADDVMAGSAALAKQASKSAQPQVTPVVTVESVDKEQAKALLATNDIAESVLDTLPPCELAVGRFDTEGLEKQVARTIRKSQGTDYGLSLKKMMDAILKIIGKIKSYLFGSSEGLQHVNENTFIGEKEKVESFADTLNQLVAGLAAPYEMKPIDNLTDSQVVQATFQSNVHSKAAAFVTASTHMNVVSEIFNEKWKAVAAKMGLNDKLEFGQVCEFIKHVSPEQLETIDPDGELRACIQNLPKIQRNLKAHLESLAVTIAAYSQHSEKLINAEYVEKTLNKSGLSVKDVANNANILRSAIAVDVLRAMSEALEEKDKGSYDASGMDALLRAIIPPAAEKSGQPSDSAKERKDQELKKAELENISEERHKNLVLSQQEENEDAMTAHSI